MPFVVDSAAYAAIRFALYGALIGLLGAALFVLLPLRRVRGLGLGSDLFAEDAAAGARRIALAAAAVLLAALPGRLIAQSFALFGTATDILGAITTTGWGRAWMLQVAGAAVALTAVLRVRGVAALWWRIALGGGLAVALGFSLSGHAAAAEHAPNLAVALDTAHIAAGGSWVGTLAVLAFAGIPAALRSPQDARASTAAALVNAFSPLALLSAGVLAVTGTFAAWEQLGAFAPLFATAYGRTLLVKLALIAVMAAIGAVNWRLLRPRLGSEAACQGIRRSAIRELMVAVLIIAVTALLVATPTHEEEPTSAAPAPGTSTLHHGGPA